MHSGTVPQTSKKANQSPWNGVGGKINAKRETKEFRIGTCKGVMKEEKFPHTKVSQARSGKGIFGTSEGSKTGSQKEKWRKFTTEIIPHHTYELRSSS